MKFLIVAPKFVKNVGHDYAFPIGLAYISSSLKSQGYEVECLNTNHYHESTEQLLAREIEDKKIDVLCTGSISPFYHEVKHVLETAKSINPEIITIIGGGLVSCEPALVLEMLPADIGVIGEGDSTIAELAGKLINKQNIENINGIVYKDEGGVKSSLKRFPIKDIDTIPYPDYDGFELDKFLSMQFSNDMNHYNFSDNPRAVPIIASRSCPYQCTFCFHPLGNKYRQHSLDYLFKEIDFLLNKYSTNEVQIYDELFASRNNYGRLIEFCHRIKSYNIKWSMQLRVDSVNDEVLRLCKDSGCIFISYGLESASNKILKSMKKQTTVQQIEKALELTYQAGIGNKGNFIFGDKEETSETVNETLNWWGQHKKYQINLSVVQSYPGTKLYHYAISEGLIKDKRQFLKNPWPVINLTKMSNEEFSYIHNKIRSLNYYHCVIPAYVVSCKKVRTDKIKGSIYSLKLICPHCNSNVLYSNINNIRCHVDSESIYNVLYCRSCGQKINVLAFNIEERIEEIISETGNEKIAIWNHGDGDTELLFKIGLRLMERTDYVISPNSDNLKIPLNKEVIHYSGNNEDITNVVKHVVYPIKEFKDEDFDQISQMERDGITILKLYAFKDGQKAVNIINGLHLKKNYEEAAGVLKQACDRFPNNLNLKYIETEMRKIGLITEVSANNHPSTAITKKKKIVYPLAQIDKIGELAKQMFFLRNLYDENEYEITVVTYPPHLKPRMNKAIYDIVMRGVKVVHSTDSKIVRLCHNRGEVPSVVTGDNSTFINFRIDDFHVKFWEKFNRKKPSYYFSLSESDIERGYRLRNKLNIPRSAPIVMLHVREGGYHQDGQLEFNSYRNASIENYIPAINYLINEGFYIVRIGDKSMKRFVDAPSQLIDAPFHPDYCDFVEPYFAAVSKFFIGCTSGPDMLTMAFGTPALFVNAAMLATMWGNEKDLYVPKKVYSYQLERYLTYEEFLLSPALGFFDDRFFQQAGIEFKENSSEEILGAVREMNARLDGTYSPQQEIEQRVRAIQAKAHYFRQHIDPKIWLAYPLYVMYLSNMQISAEYIKTNPDFLGHEWPYIAEWDGAFPKLID